MSNKVRIILILVLMVAVIGVSYWYMQETTGKVEVAVEKKWRLHDHLMGLSFCNDMHGWSVGKHGTVLHSTDGGKTWSYQKSGIARDLISVFALSPDEAWAVGQLGSTIHTTDAGKNWKKVSTGYRYLYNDVCFVNPREGWIVGEFEVILHTTDGGATWKCVHGGEPEEIDFSQLDESVVLDENFGMEEEVYTLNSIFFLDEMRGWTVGEYGTALRTVDGGATWIKSKSGTEKSLSDVDFYDTDFGFAVGLDGIILKTVDGGVSWTQQKPSVMTHYYGVHFKRYGSEIERKDALAVGQGVIASFSFHKKPYLQNWVPALEMKYNIDYDWIYSVQFISRDGERVIAVGNEGLILASDSGGNEWDMTMYPEKSIALVLNP